MGSYRELNNLNELIGEKCSYQFEYEEDENGDTKSVAIPCKILSFSFELEEDWPGMVSVGVHLEILGHSPYVDAITESEVLNSGVSIDSISHIGWP